MTDKPQQEHSVELIAIPAIQQKILLIRDCQVMLDEDLAQLYSVETRNLVQQVARNRERFPPDFMFRLSKDEAAILRSQSVISSSGHGGRRYAPYVFTEQGIAMLSSVLRSKQAVAVNITIIRAFVELRRAAASYDAIKRRLDALERETKTKLKSHDAQLDAVFKALRRLTAPPPKPKHRIGFRPPEES